MPKKAPEKIGSVFRVPLSQLHPHPQNPFAVRDDSAMQELKESVSQNGVLVPAIARPRAEGGYELIAGHRRKYTCEQAGQDSMPVIVLNLNDDEAVIQLVDSNIQREDVLPSERVRVHTARNHNGTHWQNQQAAGCQDPQSRHAVGKCPFMVHFRYPLSFLDFHGSP